MKKSSIHALAATAAMLGLLSGSVSIANAETHSNVQGNEIGQYGGKSYKLEGTSQVIPVTNLREIESGGIWEIVLTQGTTPSVRLEYDRNIADKLVVRVRGGELYLGHSRNLSNNRDAHKAVAYITVSNLRSLDISGASEVTAKNTILGGHDFELELSGASMAKDMTVRASELSLDVSGASKASGFTAEASRKLDISVSGASVAIVKSQGTNAETEADLSGASKLTLSGSTSRFEFDASGSSRINCRNFVAQDCEGEASGASDAIIHVKRTLDLEATGSSNIKVYGKPTNIRRARDGRAGDIDIM